MASTTVTGSRIILLGTPTEAFSEYECTACGRGLRGVRAVVVVPRRGLTLGSTVYSVVHNDEACIAAVT
jgi:hypothetical protein